MAHINFTVEVQGGGDVKVPVSFLGPTPVVLDAIGSVELPIRFTNPLQRPLTFSNISITTEGPAASKVTAELLTDIVSLDAGGTMDTVLTISSVEQMTEAEMATVRGQGVEDPTE